MSPTNNKNPKPFNFYFQIETTRLSASVECLNSSSAQLTGEFWHSANMAKRSFHVKSPNELNPTLSEFNEIWHTC